MRPARASADLLIDTSGLNPHQLRERISAHFDDTDGDRSMRVTVTSFGFKNGLPLDVDMVFDCRFLPNPYWEEELRPLSGRDPEIQQYVLERDAGRRFVADVEQMLGHLLPEYAAEGSQLPHDRLRLHRGSPSFGGHRRERRSYTRRVRLAAKGDPS